MLRQLYDESIDCVVTNPPYWGLRDYGIVGQIGLEKSAEMNLEKLLKAFDEVKRVLKATGPAGLHLGDTCFGESPIRMQRPSEMASR